MSGPFLVLFPPSDHAPSDPVPSTPQLPVPPSAPPSIPPWQAFDAAWYASRHPDAVADAGSDDPTSLERFYRDTGCRLGHSPNRFFVEDWYLAAYPDIAAHVAAGGARSGFEHYCQDGYRDRAPHWLFDENYYRDHVAPDGFDAPGLRNGYGHFLSIGDHEERSGHRFFDPAVARDHGLWPVDPDHGLFATLLREPAAGNLRLSWYFDPAWYLATYPEVREAVEHGTWDSALHHYLANPEPGRFEPNPWFSEAFYAATYPDVSAALAAGRFRDGYTHFLRHGAAERRRPHPDVDLQRHYDRAAVRRDLQRGGFNDSFAHWVATRDAAPADDGDAAAPTELQFKRHFVRQAAIASAQFGRHPLDFSHSGTPELSVLMVVHDRFALTMAALASLRAGFPGPTQLVLVDSGSRDETRHIARFVSGLELVRFERNLGFVEGCNAALARATAPVVLFLNNDLELGINAIPAALARLRADPAIGAVGARIVRTNNQLQEAGCIIWRDGWTSGYLRGADPDLPEANFVREVDFCSGAFLMAPRDLLGELGGFDPAFRPAYHEEVDLCVRMRARGRRVVYDPAVLVRHLEFGSSSPERSALLIERNHRTFVAKHRDWLRFQYPARSGRPTVFARSPRGTRERILFFEDQIPLRRLGSGYVRSNDIVRAMAELGYEVGVFPVYPPADPPVELLPDFPDTVEVFHDRGLPQLSGFLAERAGYYDLVWIGRTHNLGRLLPVLEASAAALPEHGFILDTEAVAAPRTIARARALELPPPGPLDALLREELAAAYFCQKIIAVNEADAVLIRSTGHRNVSVLGHALSATIQPPSPWGARSDLLFLGAFHAADSPNLDSVRWFVERVLPVLRDRLPSEVRLTLAGYADPERVDLRRLFGADERVRLVGEVETVAPLLDRHRVFVAPTRFAGGIPFKVHEAAAHGLPVVASQLLVDQVGWEDGHEILSGGSDDPERFADAVLQLYRNAALWREISDAALRRIRTEHDPSAYRERLGDILRDVRDGADPRRRGAN